MEATSGETNGEEFPGSLLGFACDHEWLLGNPSMTGCQVKQYPHERSLTTLNAMLKHRTRWRTEQLQHA